MVLEVPAQTGLQAELNQKKMGSSHPERRWHLRVEEVELEKGTARELRRWHDGDP